MKYMLDKDDIYLFQKIRYDNVLPLQNKLGTTWIFSVFMSIIVFNLFQNLSFFLISLVLSAIFYHFIGSQLWIHYQVYMQLKGEPYRYNHVILCNYENEIIKITFYDYLVEIDIRSVRYSYVSSNHILIFISLNEAYVIKNTDEKVFEVISQGLNNKSNVEV